MLKAHDHNEVSKTLQDSKTGTILGPQTTKVKLKKQTKKKKPSIRQLKTQTVHEETHSAQ